MRLLCLLLLLSPLARCQINSTVTIHEQTSPASIRVLEAEKKVLQAQVILLQSQIMLFRAEQELEQIRKAEATKKESDAVPSSKVPEVK